MKKNVLSAQQRSDAVDILKHGGLGVLPTDTIYGLVCSALDRKAVARVYRLKRRNPRKSMIVLIGDIQDLSLFGIVLQPGTRPLLQRLWPGKVSVVLSLKAKSNGKGIEQERIRKRFRYLERGKEGLAFRLPKPVWLRNILKQTGPLVAPSANFEGDVPASNIKEAKAYFGKKADFYVESGKLASKPSTIIRIEAGEVVVLRRGAVDIGVHQGRR